MSTAATLAATGFTTTTRGYFANETLNVGVLGCGGRAQHLLGQLVTVPGVKVAAVCDVWEPHREAGRKFADKAATYHVDYHEVLDNKDIDAVLIAAPDHWHVPMTVDACAAGKDVYVEKPLTHDLAEGAKVIAAQNDNKRIVQVGMQQRSMPHLQKAYELVKAGHIGEIHKVHLTWNRNTPRWKKNPLGVDPASVDWKRFVGNAPEQPFDEYRFRNWRWFWDFGGGIFTDLMVHWIDVVHWFLDLQHPAEAVSVGDWFQAKDIWETPDCVQTLLRYPEKQVQAYFEGTFFNARNASMCEFMGTDATLYVDRGRYEVIPERRSKVPASELILGTGPRGADFYDNPNGELVHLTNWVECVKSRKTPTAPVEAGVSAASAAHMANKALRAGQTARWGAT
jgi:predicted dehydrogenase